MWFSETSNCHKSVRMRRKVRINTHKEINSLMRHTGLVFDFANGGLTPPAFWACYADTNRPILSRHWHTTFSCHLILEDLQSTG